MWSRYVYLNFIVLCSIYCDEMLSPAPVLFSVSFSWCATEGIFRLCEFWTWHSNITKVFVCSQEHFSQAIVHLLQHKNALTLAYLACTGGAAQKVGSPVTEPGRRLISLHISTIPGQMQKDCSRGNCLLQTTGSLWNASWLVTTDVLVNILDFLLPYRLFERNTHTRLLLCAGIKVNCSMHSHT